MHLSSWTSEREFVDVLARRISESAVGRGGKRLRVFREFDAGFGRVDLLCVWYDEERLAARTAAYRAYYPKAFGLIDGYAMMLLRGSRWMNVFRLRDTLRLTMRRTEILIEGLINRGMVERRNDTVRAFPLSALWFVEAIEAYEAKLDKWKDAAEQASRHLWFVSRSYVTLPRLSDRVLRRVVEICQQWYLGLCILRDRETCRVELSPPRRNVPTTQLGWLVNERIFEEALHANF